MAKRLATLAEIRELAPELADTTTYPDALLTPWSTIAAHLIGLNAWGEQASDGHRLLVAHFATRAALGAHGPTGPIASESVGPASVSYASSSADPTDGELATTFYGQAYVALRAVILIRNGRGFVGNSTIRQ